MVLKAELLRKFLSALGIPDPLVQGKWLQGQCPLAPFRHKKGRDTRPSFSINTESTNFNCFTCDSGSLGKLVMALQMYVQDTPQLIARYDFKTLNEILQGLEEFTEPLPDYEATFAPTETFTEWPEWYLENFVKWSDSTMGRWYVDHGRQALDPKNQPIRHDIADKLRLLYDPGYDRIVSPFWTWTGKLAGARGRACDPEGKFKHFDYTWNKINNSKHVWYGEEALDSAIDCHRPVCIVEGQFDRASVLRVYPHCMASLTAKGSAERIKKLQNCDEVLVMLDNDEPGDEAFNRYAQLLRGQVRLGRMRFPDEFKDPAQLPEAVLYELFKDWL